jgi:coproporphyrinogen III oxidase
MSSFTMTAAAPTIAARTTAGRRVDKPAGARSAVGGARGRAATRFVAARAAAARGIEDEVKIDQAPTTLLRDGAGEEGDDSAMRSRFEKMIRAAQDEICNAISELDGKQFHEDAWTRPGGGGGISRVLQDGNVFEKAGVNVSVVYGQMPPEAYRAATGEEGSGTEMIPFFAAGISSVMHPHNPMAPTVHFNYRYFETDAPKGAAGAPRAWWFGGGTDLTPSYIFDEDVTHFHQTLKDICDKHDAEFYPKFKQWADDYFLIKHRGERRGVGGVFFDDMNDRSKDELLAFATDMAAGVVPAYVPLVAKHKDDEFTPEQRAWQQMRRGRYVEFNLVYDRGTTFGLKTGGRIESILMSLPRYCEFQYDHNPAPGSREEDALDAFKNPRTWCA